MPLLLLVAVAGRQVLLTRSASLSPWKGGGFGMFSTNDGLQARHLEVLVTAPERSEQLAIPPRLEKLAARAAVLPERHRLARLARAIARDQREGGRGVAAVEIRVNGTDYAPATLLATEVELAAFRMDIDDGAR